MEGDGAARDFGRWQGVTQVQSPQRAWTETSDSLGANQKECTASAGREAEGSGQSPSQPTTPAAKRSAAAPWLYSGLPSLFCLCFNILHAAPVICERASGLSFLSIGLIASAGNIWHVAPALVVSIKHEHCHRRHSNERKRRKSHVAKSVDIPLPVQLRPALQCRILSPDDECAIKILSVQRAGLPQDNREKKVHG